VKLLNPLVVFCAREILALRLGCDAFGQSAFWGHRDGKMHDDAHAPCDEALCDSSGRTVCVAPDAAIAAADTNRIARSAFIASQAPFGLRHMLPLMGRTFLALWDDIG
jgi:hypothetical protein